MMSFKGIGKLVIVISLIAFLISIPGNLAIGQEIGGNYLGGQVGSILQDGNKSGLAWAVIGNLSTDRVPLVREVMTKVEGSFINADRPYKATAELYALRFMSVKQFRLSDWFYVGLGYGYWQMINTDGPDDGHFAGRIEFGIKSFNLLGSTFEAYLGSDVVKQSGPDMFYLHASVIII